VRDSLKLSQCFRGKGEACNASEKWLGIIKMKLKELKSSISMRKYEMRKFLEIVKSYEAQYEAEYRIMLLA